MTTLILGVAGNLGSQLKIAYADSDVIGWDRVDFDFLDFDLLKQKLLKLKPGQIINAVAYNAVDKCEEDEKEANLAWKLNRDLPGVLADYCLQAQIPLLHYSTDYVFGGDGRLAGAYVETDQPQPLNIYGQTKLAGEQEIARRALLGLKYYIVRTSKLFGPLGKSEHAKASFFDLMLKLSADKEELKVVDAEISCFTYTPDLAQASKLLLDEKAVRGIYHLTNSGAVTWYQALQYFFDIAQIKTQLSAISADAWPRPAKRPVYSALANTRRPQLRSWQEALTDYWHNKNK
ncbi:NAD(P)-dependent oxidoreductase [Patescibacteria group bacterium]|nr:NAD(P)-dependent oxidoreductase [Patescibacteria group bacterium]